MNITAKQIAEMVNVSKQAVYSVLSNKPKCLVSPEKRARILFLAKAYHYKRNIAAVSLSGKSTNQIGAVIDSLASTEGRIISSLASKLEAENYLLKVSKITNVHQGIEMINNYISSGVDAVIFSGLRLGDIRHEDFPVPLLSLGGEFSTDHFSGSRKITEHLIREHGHRKILHVASEAGEFPKYLGYCESVKNAGLEVFPVLHTILNPNFGDELKRYLDNGVTAFVVSGDRKASRLIYYLRGMGLRVPEDVAVVGFDGFGNYPEITSVFNPINEVAAVGCEMLMQKIRGNILHRLETRYVEPGLLTSCSCGCAPLEFDNIGMFYSENGLVSK